MPKRPPKRRAPPKRRLPGSRKGPAVVTRSGLMEALGRGERQVASYIRRGMPRRADGKFEVEKCREWVAANVKPTGRASSVEGPSGVAPAERAAWETLKAREQALQEKFARLELEGRLLDVDIPAREAERRITHCRALLEQLPDWLLGAVPKKVPAKTRRELRDGLAQRIETALHALADEAETLAAEEEIPIAEDAA